MSESSALAADDAEAAADSAATEPVPEQRTPDASALAALVTAEVPTERVRPLAAGNRLDLLRNVEMDVTAELGSTRMTVRELLSLTPGNIVELNKAAGSPIDLLVNGTLIARGEVVVVDEEFGIRISEIVNPGPGEDA